MTATPAQTTPQIERARRQRAEDEAVLSSPVFEDAGEESNRDLAAGNVVPAEEVFRDLPPAKPRRHHRRGHA